MLAWAVYISGSSTRRTYRYHGSHAFTIYVFVDCAASHSCHVALYLAVPQETTARTPASRDAWTCRKAAPGPTLELRTARGRPLLARVSVTTTEMGGEVVHMMRFSRWADTQPAQHPGAGLLCVACYSFV